MSADAFLSADLLAHMKPGDIVTHCYHGRAHGIMGQEKQFLLKEVVEAQRHGIIFDCAHGRNHFNFRMIERALDQGFLPDTISTVYTREGEAFTGLGDINHGITSPPMAIRTA